LPTCLFILPVEPADGGSSRKILILHYWVGSLDRLPTDVHACDTIRVRFEPASHTTEVPPVLPILAAGVPAFGARLARVFRWNLNHGYAELGSFVGERVAEESVWYPIRLSPAVATHLLLSSSELVEAFDGDGCVMLSSEGGQLFGEEPSVCAHMFSLLPAETPQLQSCLAFLCILVSVFLETGPTVLVSDLSQRDIPSKVELLQNPAALLVHHGDSNAIGVLVYADQILRRVWRWRSLLQQHEETFAVDHQDACGAPSFGHVCLETDVRSILTDREAKPLTIAANRQYWMPVLRGLPGEEPLIEADCWLLNGISYFPSVPSIALGFLDELTGYVPTLVLCVDYVVQLSVCGWPRGLDRAKRRTRSFLEGCVGFMQSVLFFICQRQKVQRKRLLHRYLPQERNRVLRTTSS